MSLLAPSPPSLPPTMPMTIPISTSTTRISIRVMPRDRRARVETPALVSILISVPSPPAVRSRPLDAPSYDKFAHRHHAHEDRKHDPANENSEAQDQHRLKHGKKAAHRHLHLAVVYIGDAMEHLLKPARFLADQDHLRREARVKAGLDQRAAEALALPQARHDAVERARQHAVGHGVLDDRQPGEQRHAV